MVRRLFSQKRLIELSENQRRPNPPIHALTGVRALAAGWVLLFHLQRMLYRLFPDTAVMERFFESGYLGVDLFFILSGFILAYTYQEAFAKFDSGAYLRFLKLRVARIYPAHVAVTAILAVIVIISSSLGGGRFAASGDYEPIELVFHATLTHAWGIRDGLSWNGPSWSISCEWFAYLCFPFLAGPLLVVKRSFTALAGAALILSLMLLALHGLGHTSLDVTFDLSLIRVAGEFVAGILLCRAFRSGLPDRLPWDAIAVVASIAIVAVTSLWGPLRVTVFLTAALVLALAHANGPMARLLGSRPFRYGGEISYSLYMTHTVVLLMSEWVLPAHGFADASTLLKLTYVGGHLLAFTAVAAAVFHLVENPGRRVIRSLGTR